MATTAPAVTSAVDSQSTPIRSHTGRGLPPLLAGALVQDSSAGSARRSAAVAASMSATSRASWSRTVCAMAPSPSVISLKSSRGRSSLRGKANAAMSASEAADDGELTYCFSMARTYLSALDLQRPDRPRDDHSKLSLTTPLTLQYPRLRASLCC